MQTPKKKSILDYLEQTAAAYPSQTAVDDKNIRLTWSELLELSKRMGSYFAEQTEPGKPIAIWMEKSAITLAAMFGAVYAGCFYCAIDPDQPQARLNQILQVLDPAVIVTEKEQESILRATGFSGIVCSPGSAMRKEIDDSRLAGIRKNSKSSDLLYGIFTSGSTGVPKCITVSHRAVIDFIRHFVTLFGFTKRDRIANQAPFDFDVSVKDIYTCVMTGASLYLIPKQSFSELPVLLDDLCDRHITALIWAVSALTLITTLKGFRYRIPTDVRQVLFSGEVMPPKHLRLWQEALPNARFINVYGPAEITCNCTYYPISRQFSDDEKIPIGKAFPGRCVFLLDENGRPLTTPGECGEICVSGESLSEGYYHNPEETGLRFGTNTSEKRFYRTGDLGFFGEDGELYFTGRKDFQIKHMGHRIELEEIERAMNGIDGLAQSCCVMDTARNRLVAYYFGTIEPDRVKQELKQQLPVYMVPHRLIPVDQIVLNKNGKTDRSYYRKQLEEWTE